MPRIDPVSGCSVMTHAEFWAAEAAREAQGRTAADLMADFFNELDQANASQAARYRTDLAWTTEQLQAALSAYNNDLAPDEQLPALVTVLEVLEADVQDGLRKSALFLRVRALRATSGEPVEDILDLTEFSTSGSRLEPPDQDTTLEWRLLNNRPLHTCPGCPKLLEYQGWCTACARSAAAALAAAGTRWTHHNVGAAEPPQPTTLEAFMTLNAARLVPTDYDRLLKLAPGDTFDLPRSLVHTTRLTRVA